MLRQVIHGLRHLLQVEHAGPPRIARALPSLEFGLDVHQQIHLRGICPVDIFRARGVRPFPGQNIQQGGNIVLRPQAVSVQPDKFFLSRRSQPDSFPPRRYLNARLAQQLQQPVQVGRFLGEGGVDHHTQPVPVAGRFGAQPLVVVLAPALGMLHDGVPILNADRVTEPPHRPPRTEEVPKFPAMVQAGGVPDDVIMDVVAVNMGADDVSMVPLGEAAGQLTAQAVGFLRRDLAGEEGLPDGVGDHIIRPPPPPGLGKVLPLGKQKLRVRDPAVTLEAGDQPAAVCLLRILHIVDNVPDGLAHRPFFSGV